MIKVKGRITERRGGRFSVEISPKNVLIFCSVFDKKTGKYFGTHERCQFQIYTDDLPHQVIISEEPGHLLLNEWLFEKITKNKLQ